MIGSEIVSIKLFHYSYYRITHSSTQTVSTSYATTLQLSMPEGNN